MLIRATLLRLKNHAKNLNLNCLSQPASQQSSEKNAVSTQPDSEIDESEAEQVQMIDVTTFKRPVK